MSTLEKIRSKSVFLFIIIIVALLAFILGDFLTSGRTYASSTTMYSAGGTKVDYNDYQQAMSQMQNTNGQDASELEQIMLQRLLMQQMLEDQYKKLGINITDSEISRIMNGQMPISQQLGYAAQQFGLPAIDRPTVLDAINNPSRYGLSADQQQILQNIWSAEEQQLEESLKTQIYFGLIGGLFGANEIDAKNLYNDNMTRVPVQWVATSVAGASEDGIELTDADRKAAYEEMKPAFNTSIFVAGMDPMAARNQNNRPFAINEPVKAIDYIVVDIQPSGADYLAAEAEVNAAMAALQEQPALEGLMGKSKFVSNSNNLSLANIKKDNTLRQLSDSDLVVGKVKKLAFNRGQNTHTLVKVLGRTNEVDSINISAYGAENAAQADSLMALLKSGTKLDSMLLAAPDRGWNDQWVSLVGAQAPIKERMLAESVGAPFLYADSVQGIYTIYQINERKPAAPYAEIATITYTVDPSAQTVSDLKTQLNGFLATNTQGDRFSANADSLYALRHGYVTASSAHIGTLADTRKAVKWVMNAKPGQVSKVFETPHEYLVIAVKEDIQDDYLPYTSSSISNYIDRTAMRNRKAAKLIDQYAGKANNLEGYAELMGTEVRTDSTASFNSNTLPGHMGDNYRLQALLSASKPGEMVGPFQNDMEIVVFTPGERNDNGRPYDFASDSRTFINAFGPVFDMQGRKAVDPVLFQVLVGDKQVKNRSLNFVQDAE